MHDKHGKHGEHLDHDVKHGEHLPHGKHEEHSAEHLPHHAKSHEEEDLDTKHTTRHVKSKYLTPGPRKVHKYGPGSVAVPKSGSQITDRHKLKAFKGPKPTHHAQIYHESEDDNGLNNWAQTSVETSKDKKGSDKKDDDSKEK